MVDVALGMHYIAERGLVHRVRKENERRGGEGGEERGNHNILE